MRDRRHTATRPARPGAQQDWSGIWRAHGPWLYYVAYDLTHNPDDAADLQQETFRRVLQYAPDILTSDKVRGYLKKTAKHAFIDQWNARQRLRQESVEDTPEPRDPPASEEDPDLAALLRHDVQTVRTAQAKLEPRHRDALKLFAQGLSYAQIGARLGIKENAVAQLLLPARRRLSREFRLAQIDTSKLPSQCQTYLPLLADYLEARLEATHKGRELSLASYLDRKLDEPRRQQTIDHVIVCAHCESALLAMGEDAEQRVRALIPLLFPPREAQAKEISYQETSAFRRYPHRPPPNAGYQARPRPGHGGHWP
jgi:RNA polymerase sigma factor (sigma-70 family)